MTAYVRKSNAKKSIVPSWQGGRMPLSANLGKKLRETLNQAAVNSPQSLANSRESVVQPSASFSHVSRLTSHEIPIELAILKPLFELQQQLSHLPKANE